MSKSSKIVKVSIETSKPANVKSDKLHCNFDKSYKGTDIQKEVFECLPNVSSVSGWSVIDSKVLESENSSVTLGLAHFNTGASMADVGFLRGTLVDITNKIVISHGFGYTPILEMAKTYHDNMVQYVLNYWVNMK